MILNDRQYSSRAGYKLEHALKEFHLSVDGAVCADLGCSTGGFTSCLLQHGAAKVYAVDTGYGVLDYKLRQDNRVIVMERTNAMHVSLPQLVDFISVDVSWTPQRLILPHAVTLLRPGGKIISLLKPHYEAPRELLRKGKLPDDNVSSVVATVLSQLQDLGLSVKGTVESPIVGEKGGNREYLLMVY